MDRSEEEFLAFYLAHWPRLVAALSLALPPGEEPDDVAQEAFTRAFARWDELRQHPRPDGWLFLTAYRLATSLRRRAAIRMRTHLSEEVTTEGPDATLMESLVGLTSRQRAAVLLRH